MASKRMLSQLQDKLAAPDKQVDLDKMLYGDKVNYNALRKLLKDVGEEKWDCLSKSQVTRTVEVRRAGALLVHLFYHPPTHPLTYPPIHKQRYINQGILTVNSVRRAVGEKEKKEEDVPPPAPPAATKRAAKKAKTTPPPAAATAAAGKGKGKATTPTAAGKKKEEEEEEEGGSMFGKLFSFFSPSKK